MKMEQVSKHIWSLKSWLIVPVRVWVVVEEGGVTLVDAGFPFMAKGILKFIDRLNAGPLQRILLTHGHSDHVGSIRAILKHHPVPVYAHRLEIPYLEGTLVYPRRKKPEHNLPKGVARPLNADQAGHLEPVAGLQPYLTPGHSPGHVVYYHEQDRVLLAGDLFTSKNGKLKRPMPLFTADMAEAVKSSVIVSQLNPLHLEVCHGEPVLHPAAQLDAYRRSFKW
jgi:glyoxylase-like metal-dependent hydrolase (beta-lactamase superfamily II)